MTSRQRCALPTPCGCRCRRSLSGSYLLSVACREASPVSQEELERAWQIDARAVHLLAPGSLLRPLEAGSLMRSPLGSRATSSCRPSWRPLLHEIVERWCGDGGEVYSAVPSQQNAPHGYPRCNALSPTTALPSSYSGTRAAQLPFLKA